MARKKLQKFAQLHQFDNVIQLDQKNFQQKLANFLTKQDPIILELACGKGDYSLALAKRYKNKLIIGIDIQGERLWHGAKKSQIENINNVLFLRIQIENILKYLPENIVSQIWITFPDPRPKKRHAKKRLISPRFLKIYKKLLKTNGQIHLKTDDADLFNYSIENIIKERGEIKQKILNIYKRKYIPKNLKIQTDFEKKHLKKGKKIKYLRFSL